MTPADGFGRAVSLGDDGAELLIAGEPRPAFGQPWAEAIEAALAAFVGNPCLPSYRCVIALLADIHDPITRQAWAYKLANKGIVKPKEITYDIGQLICERSVSGAEAHAAQLAARPRVNASELIAEVTAFLRCKLYAPEGAHLVLAYFALNTWVYERFSSTPYLSIESPVPGCGKSTCLMLLRAICCRPVESFDLTAAAMFRTIHMERPTLLLDEQESLTARAAVGSKAWGIRQLAQAGYVKGQTVRRWIGGRMQAFDVFSPKVFATIGGLDGALGDRCIAVPMARAPQGAVDQVDETRIFDDASELREALETYGAQAGDELEWLGRNRPRQGYWPDALHNREAQLWSSLLFNARRAGTKPEAELLEVAREFSAAKLEFQGEEPRVAQMCALIEVLSRLSRPHFSPVDVVDALETTEAWAVELASARGGLAGRAARVGYFLKSFRLRRRKSSHIVYDKVEVIAKLRRYIPD